ncbi:MAG TPA: hypothetical protein VGP77_01875 [Vicinamibacterales bacterium]|nr:hypothetical protein [Vicinamibacterales bacterium]
MTKFLATAAMIAAVAHSAAAQTAQFSAAKAAAQKAVNAENAHTTAMQQPERAMAGSAPAQAKPQTPQTPQTPQRVSRVAARPPQAVADRSANSVNDVSADSSSAPIIIMREQYGYARDGRRDPFFSLIATSELRPTMSDLRLTGILFDQGGGHSVATLRDVTTDQQYRVSLGSQLGRMRVSSIRLKSIVFTIDEFGATRQDSLILGDTTQVRKR